MATTTLNLVKAKETRKDGTNNLVKADEIKKNGTNGNGHYPSLNDAASRPHIGKSVADGKYAREFADEIRLLPEIEKLAKYLEMAKEQKNSAEIERLQAKIVRNRLKGYRFQELADYVRAFGISQEIVDKVAKEIIEESIDERKYGMVAKIAKYIGD